jgi:hypothetical protein
MKEQQTKSTQLNNEINTKNKLSNTLLLRGASWLGNVARKKLIKLNLKLKAH